jgi:hypothetical protein
MRLDAGSAYTTMGAAICGAIPRIPPFSRYNLLPNNHNVSPLPEEQKTPSPADTPGVATGPLGWRRRERPGGVSHTGGREVLGEGMDGA